MKNFIKIIAIAILFISSASTCKKDDNSLSANSSALNAAVQTGSWKVTYFNENGTDHTSYFSGYTFQFNSNGTITATKATATINGTWSNGVDDSKVKLYLNFGSSSLFQELNEDWHVLTQSSSVITLQHISGGNGGMDYLTFEKL